MNDAPLVSVILPVFNAERFLKPAVDSILTQTFRDFELIIINDGSTDSSLSILQLYAENDSRIRLLSRPNTGYTVALEEAMGLARGEFLARMDADDISLPDRFALQVDYLKAHPQCVALGGKLQMIDPKGHPITEFCKLLDHQSIDASHLSSPSSQLGHPAVMMRRAAVVAAGGYRKQFEPAEDLDLWLRLAEVGKLANLPQLVLKYRMHPSSVSSSRSELQVRQATAVIIEARKRRGLAPVEIVGHPRSNSSIPLAQLALENGNYAAARYFARNEVARRPLMPVGWYLLARAVPGLRQLLALRSATRAIWKTGRC